MEELWFNARGDFLSRVNVCDRDALIALGKRHFCVKDQLVFHAGSPGKNVYILLDGSIKIFQLSSVGREVILWFCFPGEIFGLAEMMRGERREVYALACSDSTVLAISRTDFQDFLRSHAETALTVIDLLSCRLRALSDMLLNLTSDEVTSRIIKLIIRLSARYGRRINRDICLDIRLTHQEIADMIGASRQTVSTILGQLKREGVLRIDHHTIYIQSLEWFNNHLHGLPLSANSDAPLRHSGSL